MGLSQPADATPAEWVDHTYGASGVGGLALFEPRAFAVDRWGRAVLATDLTLRRLTADGAPDATFPVVMLPGPFVAGAVTIDDGGRVSVFGSSREAGGDVSAVQVIRYTDTGALDAAFGSAGTLTLEQVVGGLGGLRMTQRPDGLLVSWHVDGNARIAAVTPDGELDLAWAPESATPGVLELARPVHGLAVDGQSVVVVQASTVTRLTATGGLDETFGDGGVVSSPVAKALENVAAVDGGYLVTAYELWSSVVLKLTNDGQLDPAFGDAGVAPVPGCGGSPGVTVAGGFVYLVGLTCDLESVVIRRLSLGGALDITYGDGGQVVIDEAGGLPFTSGWGLGVQPNGQLLVALGLLDGSHRLSGVVRLHHQAHGGVVSGGFVSLAPFRLLDTRIGNGAPTGPLTALNTLNLHVTGRGGVPTTGVAAVILNIAVTQPTTPGFITAHPTGTPRPTASNLNFTAGQTIANLVVVGLGPNGTVSLYNGSPGTTHLVADIAGYYLAGTPQAAGTFQPLTPSRLLDTRIGNGAPTGPLTALNTLNLHVTGRGGVPTTGVAAVILNIAVTQPTTPGFITAHPTGTPRPTASNLNFTAGQTIANLVVVGLGPNGTVSLYNGSPGTTHLVADIAGYVLT